MHNPIQAEGSSVVQGPEIGLSKGARQQESEGLAYWVRGPWRSDLNGLGSRGWGLKEDSKTMMVLPSTCPQYHLHGIQALYTW